MGKSQREKGARVEREIANYLSDRLGMVVRRKLGQARDGADDLQVGPFRIEVKARRSMAFMAWLEQAIACAELDQIPVVIARADGKEPVAIMRLSDVVPLIAGELGP